MSQSFIEFQCSVWHPNWNRNSIKSWNYELQMENHIKCRNGGITWNSCRWMVKAPEKNIKREKRISPLNAISATFLNHSRRFFFFAALTCSDRYSAVNDRNHSVWCRRIKLARLNAIIFLSNFRVLRCWLVGKVKRQIT